MLEVAQDAWRGIGKRDLCIWHGGAWLCCATLAACNVYDGSLVEAQQANAVQEELGASACALRRPPGPSSGLNWGDEERVFVLRDVSFDQRNQGWRHIGFDLDGHDGGDCRLRPEVARSCVPHMSDAPPVLDGVHGVDNVLGGQFLPLVLSYAPTHADDAQQAQATGRDALLLRLQGYNGTNSSRVRASLAHTLYTLPPGSSGGVGVPSTLPTPLWDGSDRWWVAREDFTAADAGLPTIVDEAAYVVGRTLVMRLPDGATLRVPWGARNLPMRLSDARLSGTLSADGQRLLDVTLSGRWRLSDGAEALSAAGVCPGTVARGVLDQQMLRMVDVRADAATDALEQACDALSVGLRFTGYRAVWGGLDDRPASSVPDPCL
ncbi:MAG: hypothetical protein ACPGUV_11820 [Polyangiales bacterium]